MENELRDELRIVAEKHRLQFRAILDIVGGSAWLNFSRIEKNDYKVQISTSGDFETYESIRNDIIEVFSKRNSVIFSEVDYGKRVYGFQKELTFIDKVKIEKNKQTDDSSTISHVTIQTQINGDISSSGTINTGNAEKIDNSAKVSDDEHWLFKEVIKSGLAFLAGVASTLFAQWLLNLGS